jgi:hypothetical protein
VLTGSVPHESGKHELAAAAAAVPGVQSVENLVVVASNGH